MRKKLEFKDWFKTKWNGPILRIQKQTFSLQSIHQNTVAMNFKTILCVITLGENLAEMLEC